MSEHTPGPWKARDYKNSEGGIWVDCDAFANKGKGKCLGGTLATVHATGTGKGNQGANAILMAAAPDMLDALIQAKGALTLDVMVDENGEYFGTTKEALEAINEVLAKVGGKEN